MRTLLAVLLAAFATADAGAAILYKLVDPAGNVTFTDDPPRGFQGSVTRLDIDTGPNVIRPSQSPPSILTAPVELALLTQRQGPSDDEQLRAARLRIEQAKLAIDEAYANSTAEDWYYYRRNRVTGATRAPRPHFVARLQALEAEVVAAETAYEDLRREIRLR